MADIEIRMLGKFEILMDGKPVLAALKQSRKATMLIQYLVLQKGEKVTHKDLTDTLWNGERSTNPDMALRAIMHRFRNMIDAEGLKASVEQYNADAAAGTENAQVAAVPKRALDAEGPYYGVRVEAANHMTKGGVVCNENAQVLNADDTVVPGLYAAGEVTWQGGGYSESVCFGKVAGAQAAMAE